MLFSSIERPTLVALSLGLLAGCGESNAPSKSEPSLTPASSACTDSVSDVSALTTDAGIIGSLRDTVLGLGGRRTNDAGDELVVSPSEWPGALAAAIAGLGTGLDA